MGRPKPKIHLNRVDNSKTEVVNRLKMGTILLTGINANGQVQDGFDNEPLPLSISEFQLNINILFDQAR